jgi:hypothetical protein
VIKNTSSLLPIMRASSVVPHRGAPKMMIGSAKTEPRLQTSFTLVLTQKALPSSY